MTTVFVIGGLVWVVGCVVLVYAVLRIGALHDDRREESSPNHDRHATGSEASDDAECPGAEGSRRSA